ncbi:hypothetical protein [Larkinella humicola]|uniref:Uncharacterized protein n=1 Tax=Larkinella humicola TaxID=2607654 RepID=A0A5N1JPG5_9BACT|nr:hypothetical protein [Larkinella humicola]KAA9357367.1 hypothetical protein F0P93_06420 [Larkinella humicola]
METFGQLQFNQQLEFVFRFGKYQATRQTPAGIVKLVRLPGFFVEAQYKPDNETIERLVPLKNELNLSVKYPSLAKISWN